MGKERGDPAKKQAERSAKPIPVVDLFAGPGGLGEGFSSAHDNLGNSCFETVLSIEKDHHAHRTLELRAFFRGFGGQAPKEYYRYLRGEITHDELFESYPRQARAAASKAWHAELGSHGLPPEIVDRRIRRSLKGSQDWVLIGGPPCQAYSVIGRARMRRTDPVKFEQDPRHFLYREYLRILAIHRPPVFIMENVQGILSTRINGSRIFTDILADLRQPLGCASATTLERERSGAQCRYRLYSLSEPLHDCSSDPSSFLIRMKHYGIPQDRNRVIILGIREDIGAQPGSLKKAGRPVSLTSVIGDLPKLRSRLSKEVDSGRTWSRVLRAIDRCAWLYDARLEAAVRSRMISVSRRAHASLATGGRYLECDTRPKHMPDWFSDRLLGGVCNHASRSHMRTDLQRYLFASCFGLVQKRTPLLQDFPYDLLPQHRNAPAAAKNVAGLFSDRFRVQLWNAPATTITSHIAKDGHYFIHPDPCQCRSLTVREAARIQTFPDNYFFEGPQTSQYQQVGNAVPPLLARSIAEIVYGVFASESRLLQQPKRTLLHHPKAGLTV